MESGRCDEPLHRAGENAYRRCRWRYVGDCGKRRHFVIWPLTESGIGGYGQESSGTKVENTNKDAYAEEGMRLVVAAVQDLRRLFASFPYEVGAKTGTEKSRKSQSSGRGGRYSAIWAASRRSVFEEVETVRCADCCRRSRIFINPKAAPSVRLSSISPTGK